MMRHIVHWLMRRDLRASFARIEWVGPVPDVPADASVVLYANHHSFHDGHLLWVVVEKLLKRHALTWMEDWNRFPFFAAVGALPFPSDDLRARALTFRRTARRFADAPCWGLVYFPEGVLHPPDDGVLAFDESLLRRLDTLLPDKVWLPVALYVTWDGDARPVARLTAGRAHRTIQGDEHTRLSTLWHDLRTTTRPATLLAQGKRSAATTWDFRFTAPFFRRYL